MDELFFWIYNPLNNAIKTDINFLHSECVFTSAPGTDSDSSWVCPRRPIIPTTFFLLRGSTFLDKLLKHSSLTIFFQDISLLIWHDLIWRFFFDLKDATATKSNPKPKAKKCIFSIFSLFHSAPLRSLSDNRTLDLMPIRNPGWNGRNTFFADSDCVSYYITNSFYFMIVLNIWKQRKQSISKCQLQ